MNSNQQIMNDFIKAICPDPEEHEGRLILMTQPIGKYPHHHEYKSIHDMAVNAIKFDKNPNQQVYFAMALFSATWQHNHGKNQPSRTKDACIGSKVLQVDIDTYATPDEALQALRGFQIKSQMHRFNIEWHIVKSGGGIHLYFPLTEILPDTIWHQFGRSMKPLFHRFGIEIDKCSNDINRVLRLPGTFNKKYDPHVMVQWHHTANHENEIISILEWLIHNEIYPTDYELNQERIEITAMDGDSQCLEKCNAFNQIRSHDAPDHCNPHLLKMVSIASEFHDAENIVRSAFPTYLSRGRHKHNKSYLKSTIDDCRRKGIRSTCHSLHSQYNACEGCVLHRKGRTPHFLSNPLHEQIVANESILQQNFVNAMTWGSMEGIENAYEQAELDGIPMDAIERIFNSADKSTNPPNERKTELMKELKK